MLSRLISPLLSLVVIFTIFSAPSPVLAQSLPKSEPLSPVTELSGENSSGQQPDSQDLLTERIESPILPDWAKEPYGEIVEPELPPDETFDWSPTDSPNRTVVAGQMRSDYERIPEGFTKEEADLAEVKEAQIEQETSTRLNSTTGCQVYWPSPYEVCGAIRILYNSIGGPRSFLTFPKSGELKNPDGVGRRTEFVNGFIYWHPTHGAHTVSIPATVVWSANGWERGHFGYPVTNDIALGDGWFKQQYEGGYIYTRNSVPAVQAGIQGRIYDKWAELGAQESSLGYPIASEEDMPDGIGKYSLFQQGMMIWHPQHGAHAITGDVLLQWVYSGVVAESMGYPTDDPLDFEDSWKKQEFEGGAIYGNQLDEFFPAFNPNSGEGFEASMLRSPNSAGGNDYTDKILMQSKDGCDEDIVLRRGWYNPEAGRGGPWGYDKIVHKHGIWSIWSIKTVLENSCVNRREGDDAVYEEMVYEVECSDPACAVFRPTGESFQYRAIKETTIYIGGATETRGIKTLYPVRNTGTHGNSDVAPRWFSTQIPTLNLW
ncbi:hypothetical protein CAT723_24880 [Corynebacterium ammoniagenes]|uniref:LGFP repeat-containing protein n=2 Tax=Corynebacterium ammoniagenes TaxID=1697 RepID=A0AAV5G422_CORAM|nr:hypothetical protein CAT723_24880 [Corynebacterium ammoniagenes]